MPDKDASANGDPLTPGIVAVGTRGPDTLTGGAGDDTLSGGAGSDTLIGGAGKDSLAGGRGNDVFGWTEGDGLDSYDGGRGTDTILSMVSWQELPRVFNATLSSIEVIRGEAGDVDLTGGAEADAAQDWDLSRIGVAGDGIATIDVGGGDDRVVGTRGADHIVGGEGDDSLEGDRGDDTLIGGDGDDTLSGGAGSDTLIGGAGKDSLAGGRGNDVFGWTEGDGLDSYDGGRGTDTILSMVGWQELPRVFNATLSSIEAIRGEAGDVDLTGGAEADAAQDWDLSRIGVAGDGIATIDVGGGDDRVVGTRGADHIVGGEGDDSLEGDRGDDTLIGGDGDDTLSGGAGSDTLIGGAGSDTLLGGRGADTFVHVVSDNADGASDQYDGGRGQDTLRLVVTESQAADGDISTDIAAFETHLAGRQRNQDFTFSSIDLTVSGVRAFDLVIVPDPNSPPVVNDDVFDGFEDTVLSGNVLANDSDPDGDILSVISGTVTTDAGVTLVLTSAGDFAYTPPPGFSGTDGFTYLVTDGQGETREASVELRIAAVNDAPIATPIDGGVTHEDAAPVVLDLLLTATDDDVGDDLDIGDVVVTASDNRSVAYAVTEETGRFVLDPGQFNDLGSGETVTVSIAYTVTDGNGGIVSNAASVVVEGRDDTAPLFLTDLGRGLQAHYAFDGTFEDSTGNERNRLEGRNGVDSDSFVAGVRGGALSFDGVNDMAVTQHDPGIRPSPSYTLAAWVKADSFGSFQTLMIKGETDGGAHGAGLNLDALGGARSQYESYQGGPGRTIGGQDPNHQGGDLHDGNVALEVGVWTHVASMRDDATGLHRLYIDGELAASAVAAGDPVQSDEPFAIGAFLTRSNEHSQAFDGAIDDVFIYDRALLPTELQALIAIGQGDQDPPPSLDLDLDDGLIAYYTFDDSFTDSTGNTANDLVFRSGGTFVDGQVGRALSFQNGEFAATAHGGDVDPSPSLTLSAWLKLDRIGGFQTPLIKGETDAGAHGAGFSIDPLGGVRSTYESFQGGPGRTIGGIDPTYQGGELHDGNMALKVDEWAHVVSTRDDETGEHHLYINGRLAASDVALGDPVSSSEPFSFGSFITRSNSPALGFFGAVDDVRIYDRALSHAEVEAVFQLGGGVLDPPTDPGAFPGLSVGATVEGSSGDDAIVGGENGDVLVGGSGDDRFVVAPGEGIDTVAADGFDNQSTDTLVFEGGLGSRDLWFSQSGEDLRIDMLGGDGAVVLRDWYAEGASTETRMDAFEADTEGLVAGNVQQLVGAMAAWSSLNGGQGGDDLAEMPEDQSLSQAIAAAWTPIG